jgi:hypothetical protein
MAKLIKTKDPAIASYDYNDIEDGTGVVVNYLYSAVNAAGTTLYAIGRETPLPELVIVRGVAPTTKSFYTGEFNTPRIMAGTAMLSYGVINNAAGTATYTIKMYHYDGTTSTQLGDTFTHVLATGSGEYENINLKLDIPTTKFRVGDQVKIDIEWTAGGITNLFIGVDPQNRDSNGITPSSNANHTTVFTARLPFRIGT